MPKTMAIIQARLGSSRLPGKSMRVLKKRTLISHVVERAKAVRGLDGVVVATSDHERDDGLAEECARLGVTVFRGPEQDVLKRMLNAATAHEADVIMRITGDCPLLCPHVAEEVLSLHDSMGEYAYAWNDVRQSGYPDGTDVEVFHRFMLETADRHTSDPLGREHVTPFMRMQYRVETVLSPVDGSRWKLSVDTQSDYDFVAAVYKHLKPGELALPFTLAAAEAAQESVRYGKAAEA